MSPAGSLTAEVDLEAFDLHGSLRDFPGRVYGRMGAWWDVGALAAEIERRLA